ncbi:hypothetical protein VSS74_20775 [Conexibacter stalactiti]|uniref:EfeO-type cupredoxin-like domain-containing protein n=1 Tax=Conexibacter stalactiti TaxID=1940611 RepID=A0ABU4HU03_9ACTN|nr:hypothetical protein [Conexibacter stalactiti]MDW5596793.1 hypothetical protein [Conexibacter stalactiti]MEC5037435.1 hypothetical protein [Conexibacter stalactiti]
MSSNQRLIAIVGLVVVCALGFVVAKASEDSSDDQIAPEPSVTAPAAQAPADPAATVRTARGVVAPDGATAPARPAAPAVPRIVVRDLQPVGGVKELVFHKGDTIRFVVDSDAPEEVHLHGYDVAEDVAPGQPARFAVKANIEGIFEAELEHSGTQIASITVEP